MLSAARAGTAAVSAEHGIVELVVFDVALTEQADATKKSGLGVFLGGAGVGIQGASVTSQTSLARIQFHVPLLLPKGGDIRHKPSPGSGPRSGSPRRDLDNVICG